MIGRLLPYRTARRRARAALDERLRFETLLSGLSAGLIHVAATQIDAALEDGLRQVVAFLGVDRGTLDELNGLDAMREPCPGDRTLVITTARDGPGVKVSVRDSGVGLDGKNVDRMFQPLYTTKAEGLGMGLAVANTIVIAHGGRLGASSNEEGGATFHFTLPDGPHDAK